MLPPQIQLRPAVPADLPAVLDLLSDSSLPIAGVEDHLPHFIVASDGHAIVACGGIEIYEGASLLRSVAVAPHLRRRGIAEAIVEQLLDIVKARGVREVYLLTTTAEDYFRVRGFDLIERDQLHPDLAASAELRGACPSTATCMRLTT